MLKALSSTDKKKMIWHWHMQRLYVCAEWPNNFWQGNTQGAAELRLSSAIASTSWWWWWWCAPVMNLASSKFQGSSKSVEGFRDMGSKIAISYYFGQWPIMSHEFAPNLVNVHFLTQDQSFGTIYRCTFVLNQTLRVSRTFLRHTFLDSHFIY